MTLAAPIIVTASMGAADQRWADGLRQRHFPPERNQLPAHITLFHHLPPSQLPEIKSMLGACAVQAPPAARIDRLINLGRGVALHVESAGLMEIREKMADRLHGLLTPQDMALPRLHITIQNKVAPHAARDLFHQLTAGFQPRPLTIRALSVWWYRGGPWEPIAHYSFRSLRP